MKLANIFGMHIGCKVMILPKNSPDSFQTQLLGVSTTGITIASWQKNKVVVSRAIRAGCTTVDEIKKFIEDL